MADLYLALKGEYFDQIARGEKLEEYLLATPYWDRRLLWREYERIILTRGYPKDGGVEGVTRLTRKYRGWKSRNITHPHFGDKMVTVFAIDVSTPTHERPDNGV